MEKEFEMSHLPFGSYFFFSNYFFLISRMILDLWVPVPVGGGLVSMVPVEARRGSGTSFQEL